MTGNSMKRKFDGNLGPGRSMPTTTASTLASIGSTTVPPSDGFSRATAGTPDNGYPQQLEPAGDAFYALTGDQSLADPFNSYRSGDHQPLTSIGAFSQLHLPSPAHWRTRSYGATTMPPPEAPCTTVTTEHLQGTPPALYRTTLPPFAVGFGNLDPEGAPPQLPSVFMTDPDDRQYWGVDENDLRLNQAAATISTFARIEKSILYTLANSRTASNEPVPNAYVKDTDLERLRSVIQSGCLAGSAVTGLTAKQAESRRRRKFGRSFAMLIVAFQGYYHNNPKELKNLKVSFGKAMRKDTRESGEAAKVWIDGETAAYNIIVWIELIARTWRDAQGDSAERAT